MDNSKEITLTAEGRQKLVDELAYREGELRDEIVERLKEARSFGDLSENSEYDEAKTEQGKLYSRIAELKDLIENAVIDNSTATAGTVGHGSTVKVRDLEDNSETEYHIVGSQDANPMLGRISSDSPFGMALFGHKKGETVTFDAPAGAQSFAILAIDN